MKPRVGSLCTGYGGLDLGLELAIGPVEHAWHVEYDKHPSAILAHRFPGVPNLGDLTAVDWTAVESVDVLTAGFPCQDVSMAGKRTGLREGTRTGIWAHIAEGIGVLRPRLVVIENVRGLLSAGADSDVEPCAWCLGDDADEPAVRALGAVLADLAELGYDTRWGVVRAADAGAPHGRARVFIVASDAQGQRGDGGAGVRGRATNPVGDSVRPVSERGFKAHGGSASRTPAADADRLGHERGGVAWRRGPRLADDRVAAAAHTDRLGRQRHASSRPGQVQPARDDRLDWGPYARAVSRWEAVLGRRAPRPTEPGRTGERLSPRFVEWMMGLPAGWVTDVPGLPRNAQLKALGNGVVPQQAALALCLLGVTAGEAAA